ncbi:MAG: sensor domain-containing diguanylate cyclase [Actinomycetota bacterium]
MTDRFGASKRPNTSSRALLWAGGGQKRLAVFTAFRACIPLFTLVGLAAAQRQVQTGRIAGLLSAQVGLTIVTMALAVRKRAAAPAAVWMGIVGDLVVITALCALTGGAGGPLTFLYTIEAVAAGILLSSKLGLRVLGISMAAIIALDIAAGRGLIDSPATGVQGLLAVTVLWITAGGALAFSALNERDILRHAAELQTIHRITLDIEDSLSIQEIMGDLCRGLVEGFQFTSAATLVRDGDVLTCAGGHNLTGASNAKVEVRGPISEALSEGHPVIVASARARSDQTLNDLFGARGYVAVPLGGDGLIVATRAGRGRRGGVVRAREIEALRSLAHHASLALANAKLHEHVTAMARTDPLTGLHNHGEFQRILANELGRIDRYSSLHGQQHHLSLLLIDIDHFKKFNDTFGHQSGDEVLHGVSDAIRSAVRTFDHPARYGGEEMAVVLPETDLAGALTVAERVRAEVEAWEGGPRGVTVSIGVATAPSNGKLATELVAAADHALYASKESGRNKVTAAIPGKPKESIISLQSAKIRSRRSQQAAPLAAGESTLALEQSSRPRRRIPHA